MRRSDFGESSRIVQLCTRDYGRLSFLAKGAHRRKTCFLVAIDLFHIALGRVGVKEGRGLQNLYSLRVIQGNRPFRSDPLRLALACQMTELVRIAMPLGRPDPELFDLYRGSLTLYGKALRNKLASIDLGIKLRFLRCLGQLPSLECCPVSGKPLPRRGKLAFDPARGGFLHPEEGNRHVGAGLASLAGRLVELDGRSLAAFATNAVQIRALYPLVMDLLEQQLEGPIFVRVADILFEQRRYGRRIKR